MGHRHVMIHEYSHLMGTFYAILIRDLGIVILNIHVTHRSPIGIKLKLKMLIRFSVGVDHDIWSLWRNVVLPTGGWSVINVPGDGTVWGLNSTQFIREKMFNSGAFYSLTVTVEDAFSEYHLEVHLNTPACLLKHDVKKSEVRMAIYAYLVLLYICADQGVRINTGISFSLHFLLSSKSSYTSFLVTFNSFFAVSTLRIYNIL